LKDYWNSHFRMKDLEPLWYFLRTKVAQSKERPTVSMKILCCFIGRNRYVRI